MPKVTVDEGYVQADSDNLPKIDTLTLFSYLGQNADFVGAEMKNVKAARSARENYGDNAVGYVQVKRQDGICLIKGRITPEHSVRKSPYPVQMKMNENNEEILSVECEGCTASLGGCKHAIAFLMWLHRRSEEPATTSKKCYWKKSKMSEIGNTLKFIKARDMREQSNADIVSLPPDYKQGSFLQSVIERSDSLGRMDTELTKYYKNFNEKEKLSLHHLLQEYFDMILDGNYSADKSLAFCRNRMKKNVCQEAASATVMQANCALWHELRYGRITASKAYDAMHCHKMDGSLVEMVLGASKLKDTVALKRGRMLEKEVMSSLQQTLNMKIEPCGIMLSSEYPVIGASPDGICHDYIVEIKCPASEKTLRNYITSNKTITAKYFAQMQMQMHLYEKEKGIFCVANSDYELTKKINVLTVQYDKMFCEQMLQKCTEFWSKAIFTRLSSNYL